MATAAVQTLATIAEEQASAGDAWAALTARMAADSLVAGKLLQESEEALLDIGPLRSLTLDTDVLSRVHERYRQRLLQGLKAWDLDGEAEALLGPPGLPDLLLHAGLAGEFARGWLDGDDLATAIDREKSKARRFAALAARLADKGQTDAAEACYRASDLSAFVAHHAAASHNEDPHLPLIRCAQLIAEHLAADARPAGAFRWFLDSMVLCGGRPERAW